MTTIDMALEMYSDKYQNGSGDGAVLWGEDFLKSVYWSKQKEIIHSVFNREKTVVKACHSSSKTYTAGDCVLAFLCLCYPCKIVTTAPTFTQVHDLLWADIRRKYDRYLAPQLPGAKILQTRLEIDPDWFAVGISTRDTVNFTGFHQENILVVFDEAPGVKPEIVEAAETLGASGNVHYLWIGNPTKSSGHFFDAFRNSDWYPITIGYKDTPNFTDEGKDLPERITKQLISPQWVEGRRKNWGEGSPLFMSRVEAQFPEESAKQVISLALCEAAANRDEILPGGDRFLGVDVARYGVDLTAYAFRRGNVIERVETESNRDTMYIAGKIMAWHRADPFREIVVDSIGVGAGVVDRLAEMGAPVRGLDVREVTRDSETYFNRRTEVWFEMKEWLRYGRLPNDMELFADLTAPEYGYHSTGKYRVESKDETKSRLKRSPDRADAAILAAHASGRGGLEIM